jgi:hypothetical protein
MTYDKKKLNQGSRDWSFWSVREGKEIFQSAAKLGRRCPRLFFGLPFLKNLIIRSFFLYPQSSLMPRTVNGTTYSDCTVLKAALNSTTTNGKKLVEYWETSKPGNTVDFCCVSHSTITVKCDISSNILEM